MGPAHHPRATSPHGQQAQCGTAGGRTGDSRAAVAMPAKDRVRHVEAAAEAVEHGRGAALPLRARRRHVLRRRAVAVELLRQAQRGADLRGAVAGAFLEVLLLSPAFVVDPVPAPRRPPCMGSGDDSSTPTGCAAAQQPHAHLRSAVACMRLLPFQAPQSPASSARSASNTSDGNLFRPGREWRQGTLCVHWCLHLHPGTCRSACMQW